MRAVLIKGGKGPVENLFIGNAPKPSPSAQQVLVKIKAFGLNRMDLSQREGHYPPPPGSSDILGVEFSGTVDELGSSVTEWKTGDEVLGLAGGGAYAEYIAVAKTHIWRKPTNLSWVEAASIPENWLTAFQAVSYEGGIQKGEVALVHAGASGVGVAANQLARFFGASRVFTTASSKEKLDWLLKIPEGPTDAINYKTENFAEIIKKETGGKGVNLIVDFVGKDHWEKNIDALSIDGRMILLAFLSGNDPKVNLGPLLYKRLRIQGSTLRSRSVDYQTGLIAAFRDKAFGSITGENGNGLLKSYIHAVYPWTKVQEAHKEMAANANSGKIILEVV
ncbi:quinone oxidoreductase putative [Sistotremastrum suecicum HHB10207 ss-3]|uniref:Quinone oxidoreductase putative n=1 Tax=Sistotremastrum suecicum HHB10207 ss-3 TaxID=1314776 RepID=A0A166A7Y4_9AGAM|nr:quinone oxidoreductase putative [Sistotremastrum suecicum HHB10207 ss-3]